MNVQGSSRSRLDRILFSDSIIDWCKISGQVENEYISDHNPIWIRSNNLDWEPKPFKTLSCWYDHEDFLNFVKREWESFDVQGNRAFVLKEKMKRLMVRLKW